MNYLPDRLLIRFHAETPRQKCAQIHRLANAKVICDIKELGVQVVETAPSQIDKCLQCYANSDEVEYVERDAIVKKQLVPNDPLFSQQWGVMKVVAVRAWNITRGSTKVPIAVLDTGIDATHPDLQAKIILNANFSDSSSTQDFDGHGTHVSGIAAAVTKNGTGVAGLAINPTLMNIKVLGDDGTGSLSSVVQGIVYATNNGAKVINMSLGTTAFSSILHDAVKYAQSRGVLMAAAAGNDGLNQHNYPAAFAQCISVAAVVRDDTKAIFSNFGASWVDLAAPGVDILSTMPTYPNGSGQFNYGYLSGTSMSTPLVSGLLALLLSLNRNPKVVRQTIESTTVPVTGTGTLYEFGRINAYNALLNLPR
ncbi:S8 family peptidase [Alteribacillus bidgolensis]|uniref:Thermitase Serine peptidase. MEROPS family S08A n=1 Tax=Alteribacillus bidgolensis TaxID=930129 RepID=A0A1G8S6L9_9BACI|nr:S8 family peptidase [Alteribacillus bidgolensis]SDJ24320.1 thermitase Serine peptidase. MEROPS family S08A [Alteribacillus bidgolensis]